MLFRSPPSVIEFWANGVNVHNICDILDIPVSLGTTAAIPNDPSIPFIEFLLSRLETPMGTCLVRTKIVLSLRLDSTQYDRSRCSRKADC